MDRTYDIFETVRDSPIWKESVSGHEAALIRMQELAKDSQNEFRLMHLSTNAVVAIIDAKKKPVTPSVQSTPDKLSV